jgi:hypothetical protein
MSTEWLMSVRDTEIAGDIEQAIESEREAGGSGSLVRINYATGLVEHVEPANASDAVQAHRSPTSVKASP